MYKKAMLIAFGFRNRGGYKQGAYFRGFCYVISRYRTGVANV